MKSKSLTGFVVCVMTCVACVGLSVLCFSAPVLAEVESNVEVHRVVGGLYSLAAAVNLKGTQGGTIAVKDLARYFGKDAAQWLATVKVEKHGNVFWVGVPVDRYSTARRFLRNSAADLNITENPSGETWFSGGYAWLAVSGLKLKAATGTAPDTNFLFLSVDGTDFWWQNLPALTADAMSAALKHWGTKEPGLHVPTGDGSEKLSATPVGLPEEFHTTAEKDPFAIDIGDNLIFNPIPHTNTN